MLVDLKEHADIYKWLLKLPGSVFHLTAKTEVDVSTFLEMGYKIQFEHSNNPYTTAYNHVVDKGGILATRQFNPDHIPDANDKVTFFKTKVKDRCPWCINGFFRVDSNFIAAPPDVTFLTRLKDKLGIEDNFDMIMTMEAKKNLRFINFETVLDVKKTKQEFGKYIESYPFFSQSYPLSDGLRIIGTSKINSLEIKNVHLDCKSEMPSSSTNQAGVNSWLSTCNISSSKGVSEIEVKVDEETHRFNYYHLPALVTIVVKTFGRMEKVFELVSSARRLFPDVEVIVGNDSADAYNMKIDRGFTYVPFPYDIGLSEGRNRLVEKVKTKCVLFLDDDFIFTEQSDLTRMVHELITGKYDIVGGESPKCDAVYTGMMRIEEGRLILQHGTSLVEGSSCLQVDIIPNLFMTRTALLREQINWDASFKVGEHEDFFWRAKALNIRVGTCPGITFEHVQIKSEAQSIDYKAKRARAPIYLLEMLKKHGLTELVAFGRIKAKISPLGLVRRVKTVSLLPFSAGIVFETQTADPFYLIELVHQDSIIQSTRLDNPDGLQSIHFHFKNLEPKTTYQVIIRPGNHTVVSDTPATLNIHTPSFKRNSRQAYISCFTITTSRFDKESNF